MVLIKSLVDEIISMNKLQKKFLESSLSTLSIEDTELLQIYIKYCTDNGITLNYLAQSYNLIVTDTLREQIYFKKYKKYRYSTFQEVSSSVYYNPKYMNMYMHGLALTTFLWPNHAKIMAYFRKTIPQVTTGIYLEIGTGHGFYFMEAMRLSKYSKYIGIDISPTSIMMTNALLKSIYFGSFSSYEIKECNFLDWNINDKFDAVVMGEVLEHAEKPESFLKKISDISHSNSYIFITTCINSPAIDHIYLFENYNHIKTIIESCNLYVKDHILVPYNNLTIEESEKEKLPINIALILGKANE